MSQQTLVNGNRYSFVNISLSFGNVAFGNTGVILPGENIPRGAVSSITYKATQDSGTVQGNQVAPVGRTTGYGTATGGITLLAAEFDAFIATLTNNGAYPIMNIDFDLTVAYSVNDIDTRQDFLQGCRIVGIDNQNQNGSDASMKQLDINILRVKFNGVSAYADPAQQ